MPRLKDIGVFFVRLAVCYGLLLAAWPLLKPPYTAAFRAAATICPGVYRVAPDTRGVNDTEVVVQETIRTPQGMFRGTRSISLSARRIGYFPTAFVLSLVLATPLPWNQKLRALVWSLALVNAFIILELAWALAHARASIGLVVVSPLWLKTLAVVRGKLLSTNMPLFVSFLVWVFTTLWRTDWLRGGNRAASVRGP